MEYRIGSSKDIHILVPNRRLMLGGIHIPYELGEKAHSDGDVVYHALSEAILGALALGDLGHHFPDNDPTSIDMNSSIIVKHVVSLMKEKGYKVNNVDIFISLERPKLASYISNMRNNVATLLEINEELVSIKTGTNEGVGPVGEGKAVEANCVILLRKD